jgi:hormone-sensitive lipase
MICENLIKIHNISENGNLYSSEKSSSNIITNSLKVIDQTCFHGRAVGFQFCESLKPILNFLDISMTSYSELYFSKGFQFIRWTNLMISASKYLLNPDVRADRYINVTHNAPIDFCKSYWQLGEQKFMHILPTLFGLKVEVCHAFQIHLEPLKVFSKKQNVEIDVPLPRNHSTLKSVSCRLISSKRRGKMIGQKNSTEKLSDFLILHVSLRFQSE